MTRWSKVAFIDELNLLPVINDWIISARRENEIGDISEMFLNDESQEYIRKTAAEIRKIVKSRIGVASYAFPEEDYAQRELAMRKVSSSFRIENLDINAAIREEEKLVRRDVLDLMRLVYGAIDFTILEQNRRALKKYGNTQIDGYLFSSHMSRQIAATSPHSINAGDTHGQIEQLRATANRMLDKYGGITGDLKFEEYMKKADALEEKLNCL